MATDVLKTVSKCKPKYEDFTELAVKFMLEQYRSSNITAIWEDPGRNPSKINKKAAKSWQFLQFFVEKI